MDTQKRIFPTIGNSWGILLILFVTSAVVTILLNFLVDQQSSLFFFLSYTITFGIVGSLLVLFQKHESGMTFSGLFKKFDLRIVPYLLVLVIGFGYVSDFITSLIPMPKFIEELFRKSISINIWGFITVCLAAPFLEELIFRGVFLRSYLHNTTVKKALFWSAFFFALVHLNPWQAIPAFFLGYLMAWLFYKTGSLIPAILVHFLNNTISFIGAAVYDGNITGVSENFEWKTNAIISSVGLLIALYCLFRIVGLLKSDK